MEAKVTAAKMGGGRRRKGVNAEVRNGSAGPHPVVLPPSSPARPFVKWAGGKGQMLEQYRPLLPSTFGCYHEPFVGGGALFFDLQSRLTADCRAKLTDANEELVNAYRVVRDDPEALLRFLDIHRAAHSEQHYYEIRAADEKDDVVRAARLLYLNRVCFNGLYRVNRAGKFNVPFGRYVNPRIVDEENIRACSAALYGTEITCADFRAAAARARPGDFVYFDPPYDVSSKTSRFTAFTSAPFGWAEQEALAETFGLLAARGVRVMASNADTERVRELYRHHDVRTVSSRRAINSSGGKRAAISEVVVLSYEPEDGR